MYDDTLLLAARAMPTDLPVIALQDPPVTAGTESPDLFGREVAGTESPERSHLAIAYGRIRDRSVNRRKC